MSVVHGTAHSPHRMKLARAKPVPPCKGRPAALGASPSRPAQRVERGGRREATQGVFHFISRPVTAISVQPMVATSLSPWAPRA